MPMCWGNLRKIQFVCHKTEQVQSVKEIYIYNTILWNCLLTGPTQLRTITACLHIVAKESGSSTSATMMSTSVLSSGLPANTCSVRGGAIVYLVPCLPFNSDISLYSHKVSWTQQDYHYCSTTTQPKMQSRQLSWNCFAVISQLIAWWKKNSWWDSVVDKRQLWL